MKEKPISYKSSSHLADPPIGDCIMGIRIDEASSLNQYAFTLKVDVGV